MKWVSIGKIAEEYGVTTQTIRNWEKEGMFSEVMRTRGGHRRFTEEEISREFDLDNIIISNKLVIRKSDGAVMGEILI